MISTTKPLVAALLLGGTTVAYAEAFVPGDPIDAANVATVAELVRIADALDAAVDVKAWDAARSLFTDEITVDFTSLVGGEPATIPADTLIAGWSTNLTDAKTSYHQRGNHLVSLNGPDSATMTSHGYAWNRMDAGADEANGGNPLWEVWGVYTHGFERVDGRWLADSMTLDVTHQRGNEYVRDTVPGS